LLYILDRLIVHLIAFAIAVAVFYPFRRWKHGKILNILILFVAVSLSNFSPTILFTGSASAEEDLPWNDYQHVDSFSYGDALFSVSDHDYTMDDHVYTSSQVVMYEPWLVGFYESEQEETELTYIYDDGAGTREVISFHVFELEDGSTITIVCNNLTDPLDTLVIEGQAIACTAIGTSKYSYFILPPDTVFDPYRDSVLFNGVEIGRLFGD